MRVLRLSPVACAAGLTLLLLAGAMQAPAADANQRYRASDGPGLKVQVSGGSAAVALSAGGARLVADYGSFQVFEANAAALQELGAQGVEAAEHLNRIELHAGVVDTTASADRAARLTATRATTFSGKRLHLVQFAGPVKPEWYEALLKTRVQVVDYIPHNAYLVYGTAAALASVQQLAQSQPALQFEGSFLDIDKIHPLARAGATKRGLSANPEGLYQVQLVTDEAANADTLALIDALKLAPIVRQNQGGKYLNVVVKLPADALDGLAGQPDVISIWPYTTPRKFDERQGMILAGNLSGGQPSGPGYLAWLASKGFTQSQFDISGLVVDVTDSGLDNGTTNVNHFALYRGGTTSDIPRVRYARLEGTANSGSTIQGCDGHGNLNSHIIAGYVSLTNFPHTDSAGYRFGLGIAPFVKVGSSVIFDPGNFTSPDYEDLASRAYRDGARVSGNSWGADTAGGYDADAQAYDAIVRDAQPAGSAVANSGNQQMTFVFAAGNAGSSAGTVGSPGTAKNVITVGAAENAHSHATTNGGNSATGADGCDTPDSEANSANDVASFSSRGPCSDSRKKPEIMAPGTHVTGGVGQNVKTMTGNGTALTCFDGTGVCALPGGGSVGSTNNFFPLGQKWYSTSSGTSHSTPAVAGGAALVYQWFLNNFANPPSPAMIKAFLMNAARYMTGTSANDTLYSNNQGMGMMNLGTAFDGTQRLLRDQVTNEIFTASGQTRTYTGQVVSNSKPLRVTLTWTDAPGSTSGNSYNNNLNLSVVVNGQTYLGNVFSGQYSTSGGSADVRNNAESVFLPAGTTGAVVITVSAGSINSDGVPNYGTALDQDYALVAYNFQEVQTPVIASAGIAITSESCGLGNGAPDPDEILSVRFALQNVGSADTTNVMATLQATGGVTSPNGPFSYGALLAGGAAISNTFTFTATGTCGGTVTATLALQDGATSLGSIVQTFTIGGTTAATTTFANASTITINDNASASPYPSTINVSGTAGAISKVVVELLGFSHTYPADADVVLVGPGGQKVALMGAVGGGTDATGANLTFDDAASGQIVTVATGTYQPSGSVVSMPSPAPSAPYGSALADFNGFSANGTWSLYVVDAEAADSGSIAQGWRLRITAGEPLCCASNQPPLLSSIGSKSVTASNTLTFTVGAVDPYDGDTVTLSASNLPAGAVFATVTNVASVTNTFLWTNALPLGVYTTTFYAVDKDGVDSETIQITVQEAGGTTNHIVDFEGVGETKGGYASGTVTLSGKSWNLTDALIGTGTSDRKNGARSARVQNTGTMTMLADIADGVGAVSFLYGSYGTDASSAMALDFSTDGGSVWANAGTVTVSSTTLQSYSTNIAQGGNVRLRFRKTAGGGARANIDDIITTSYGGAPAQTPPVLAAIGAKNVTVSNLLQFTVTATPTDGDAVTLTASNLPGSATFGATNENGIFVWTEATPAGVYTSTFYAADDDGVDSEAVVITVGEQAPVSTNFAVLYVFEDGSSNFTRAAQSVAAGLSAGLFDTQDGSPTSLGGNPVWAVSDTGFTGSNYFHFTLTADAGVTVNLSRLKFDDRRSNTGPSTWRLRSSADAYTADIASGGTHTSFTTNEASLSLTVTGAITFRVYGQAGTAGGTWRLDNVSVLGGSGGASGTDQPSVTITTLAQTVSNPTASIPVGGTANTNTVGELAWTNALTGGSGTTAASTNWLISSVALNVGANTITVRGTNATGGSASANVTITRQSSGGGGGDCAFGRGGLAVIGYQSDTPDKIAFVALSEIPAGTAIRFTDSGWQASGSFRINEGGIEYTAPSNLSPGAVAVFTAPPASPWAANNTGFSASLALATDGDQILAFTNTVASPGFIYALTANAAGFTDATDANTTALPTGLTNGTTALSIGDVDNGYYNGPLSGSPDELRVHISTATNWLTSNSAQTWPSWSFTVTPCGGGGDTTPSLVITTAPQTVAVGISGIAVGGTSSNLAGEIRWTNALSGGAGSIAAAADWLIANVGLNVGTNGITVSGTNSLGVATSATVAIVRESNDVDADTIPDDWELSYFGSLTNVNETSDWDGDRFLDIHEQLAGSNPTNDQSLLKAVNASPTPTANGLVVQWQSESNREYIVSRSPGLPGDFIGIASNILGIYPLNTYTDAASTNATLLYRIELQLQ